MKIYLICSAVLLVGLAAVAQPTVTTVGKRREVLQQLRERLVLTVQEIDVRLDELKSFDSRTTLTLSLDDTTTPTL